MGARARWRCVSIVVMGRLSVYLSLRASRRHDLKDRNRQSYNVFKNCSDSTQCGLI